MRLLMSYSDLIGAGGGSLARVSSFASAVRRTRKERELASFVLWEIQHRAGLRAPDAYATFRGEAPGARSLEPGDGGALDRLLLANRQATADLERSDAFRVEPAPVAWRLVVDAGHAGLFGSTYGAPHALAHAASHDATAATIATFPDAILGIHATSRGAVLVCSGGVVYRGEVGRSAFVPVLTLASNVSRFLPGRGIDELPDGRIVFGEYGNVWDGARYRNLAYVHWSEDDGRTWASSDFLARAGVNKHVHLVRYSRRLDALFLADGDNLKKVWINRSMKELGRRATGGGAGWELLNRLHVQTGGYTSMVETTRGVLFGTDYNGGSNFLVETRDGRTFEKRMLPDPYRRSPILTLVERASRRGTEIWAFTRTSSTRAERSLVMISRDEGRTWTRLVDYDGTSSELKLVSTSRAPTSTLYLAYEVDDSGNGRVFRVVDEPATAARALA